MKLSEVVPWGRSLAEYREMFALTSDDLSKRILGCADGPASFNAELTAQGGNIVSVDPIYKYGARQLAARIQDVAPQIMEQIEENLDRYCWQSIPNSAALKAIRTASMDRFLHDYEQAGESGRYIDASLPALPFDDGAFDLALCSHFLFLYSRHIDLDLHVRGVLELCRVAGEVRIYPLISIDNNQVSPHLAPVIAQLERRGIDVSVTKVEYEFQKGATSMFVARNVEAAPRHAVE